MVYFLRFSLSLSLCECVCVSALNWPQCDNQGTVEVNDMAAKNQSQHSDSLFAALFSPEPHIQKKNRLRQNQTAFKPMSYMLFLISNPTKHIS